jgi:4-diphosphocytidyl-2-C-methyl-D-erythritol kinase
MTGSGACVFCAFGSEDEADAVLAKVPPVWTGWKAKALERHPLDAVIEAQLGVT